MLGVHVPALTGWTRQHPWMNMVLTSSYATPLWQFAVAVPVLGIFLKDRRALWEYVANFHFCAIVTVAALALIPAECAFQHYGFTSTIDQARFIGHFNGFRGGSLTLIRFTDIEGLISMPSFHVAGALAVTWAFRRHPWLLAPCVLLNSLLVAATFMTGAHYFIDVLLTIPLFALSAAICSRWVNRCSFPGTH